MLSQKKQQKIHTNHVSYSSLIAETSQEAA